jgi:hypothetical protein
MTVATDISLEVYEYNALLSISHLKPPTIGAETHFVETHNKYIKETENGNIISMEM